MILANLYGVHIDPVTWSDPDKFNPDRFLDENSGQLIGRDRVIPFSIGLPYVLLFNIFVQSSQ